MASKIDGNTFSNLLTQKFTSMIRTAPAVWNGSGKEGNGHLTTQSTVLNQHQYSYHSRFENCVGTNPEELIAAAHAGCYSMKLSFVLGAMAFTPETLETQCAITLDNGVISQSHLTVKSKGPGISKEQFDAAVKDAETNCPVSKALNMAISSEATLL
jgi:osmotically inducible protein OsmC